MPVKVRCTGCEKVLNVPDRARGKAIRCPKCETVLKVPAGKPSPDHPPRSPQQRPAQPVKAAADDDRFLAGMDLRRAQDTRVRVCVKCGAEAPRVGEDEEEVIDCPNCGHNIDTGVMSEYMRKKRSRRGPDPEEFWGEAWRGSLKFVGQNVKLVMRTGIYWSIFLSLSFFAVCCATMCTNDPPYYFWIATACFFFAGATGWYWTCNVKVIQHTMGPKRKRKLERFHFDFFANIALGIKSVIWPYILFFFVVAVTILALIIPMMIADSYVVDDTVILVGSIVSGIIGLFALLVLPLSMIHMSMPYTYKAWIPYYMAISLGKNILPALYWLMMAIAVLLPASLILLIFHLVWEGGLSSLFAEMFIATYDLILFLMTSIGLIKESKVGEYPYTLKIIWWAIPIFFGLLYLFVLLVFMPICILYAFPAVFLMRANAYIGLYFHDKLDLVKEQKPNEICGFWPRYLALLVDLLVLNALMGIVWGIVYGLGALFVWMGLDYLMQLMLGAGGILSIIVPWMYFAKPESMSVWRASIGKRSIGLVVTDEDGDTLTFQQATGRFFAKWYISQLLLGVGYIMAAFHEKKQALHDTMAGTIVVWQGDDERNEI